MNGSKQVNKTKSPQYDELYRLQDEVLKLVFSEPSDFYLTGGTALSRFYLNHRYSDDLDFFTHETSFFSDSFRLFFAKILASWNNAILEVDARDFKRLKIENKKAVLKLDFVADRISRSGSPVLMHGCKVDTVRNILSNKLCAILGRDEARDVFDLICIARARSFTWPMVIEDALRKEKFSDEELVFRLESFPVELLKDIPVVIDQKPVVLLGDLLLICKDIKLGSNNSIAAVDAPQLA